MDLLGIGYVGELVQLTPGELWIRRNFGMKTFKVVEKMLEDMGLTFSMRLSPKAQYALERVVKERLKKSQNIWKKYDKKII
jgi:DNA-directed RNA polymerase alpha subunit